MDHRHFLNSLFEPKSVVVVIDGDAPPEGWVNARIERLRVDSEAHKRPFFLYPLGKRSARPGFAPDLVLIVVPPARADAGLEAAGSFAARNAVIFAEPTIGEDTRRWAATARRLGVRLFGPDTLGFVRPAIALNASRIGDTPRAGNVALVSQSGMLNGAVLDWAGGTSIGFSLVVSMGAEAMVDMSQVLDFLAADRRTKAVVMYVEAVHDTRAFMSALRALASIKPVIVLKGHIHDDRHEEARTHSGAITGSNAVYSAAFRRAGAVQIRLFTQLFTAARCLASRSWPVGDRLAIISNGHGPAVLAADQAIVARLTVPPPGKELAKRLRAALPDCKPTNPLNLGAYATADDYIAAVQTIGGDDSIDALLVMMSPYDGVDMQTITERVTELGDKIGKPLFACWMGEASVRSLRARIDAAQLPVFRTPEAGVHAYATIVAFHRNQQLLQQTPRPLSDFAVADIATARRIVETALAEGRQVLSDPDAKALLEAFHIPVTRPVLTKTVEQGLEAARKVGYPVVLKVVSQDILHKTEVGGVVLNVRNDDELRAQYEQFERNVRAAAPEARIDGIAVEAMKGGHQTRELYVGLAQDPQFGPVLAFGAGGTRIEVMRDFTLEFPPLNGFLARRMIERTRIAETLGDFRGAPAVDLDAVENVLVRVSEMVCELPQLRELDINPLLADSRGIVAVDARFVIGAAPLVGGRYGHLAIMPYPAHITRRHTLRDGTSFLLRPIRPEDANRLQAFARGLSEQSRYFRFISAMTELPPKMLVRYTQIDYDREMAIVAIAEDERIIGVVRYLLYPDRDTCEFALTVADEYQGRGLGSTLMREIAAQARAKGLKRIEGFVLASNDGMLRLMRHLGYRVEPEPSDPTMRLCSLDLG